MADTTAAAQGADEAMSTPPNRKQIEQAQDVPRLTVRYSRTEYVRDNRVTHLARLMSGDACVCAGRECRTEQDTLVTLAAAYVGNILDDPYSPDPGPADPTFPPLSALPADLSASVERQIAIMPKRAQSKIRARIRHRERLIIVTEHASSPPRPPPSVRPLDK